MFISPSLLLILSSYFYDKWGGLYTDIPIAFKGTAMKIEKALTDDRLRVSKVS